MNNLHRNVERDDCRQMLNDGERDIANDNMCEGTHSVHLSVYPYKVMRWGGGGFKHHYCATPSRLLRLFSRQICKPAFTCCDFHYPGCLFRHSNPTLCNKHPAEMKP
ncbi:hypothetical protein EYF80_008992 [Liparis tanakae]|uniref:Uncharacterized protein n=1 Tax=Liparis tanakae TaxID=230148 RepID=A0A4Z2IT33_9TELE|nr:hypothetical protein EYF80_008992 [Liparis tanakae]